MEDWNPRLDEERKAILNLMSTEVWNWNGSQDTSRNCVNLGYFDKRNVYQTRCANSVDLISEFPRKYDSKIPEMLAFFGDLADKRGKHEYYTAKLILPHVLLNGGYNKSLFAILLNCSYDKEVKNSKESLTEIAESILMHGNKLGLWPEAISATFEFYGIPFKERASEKMLTGFSQYKDKIVKDFANKEPSFI